MTKSFAYFSLGLLLLILLFFLLSCKSLCIFISTVYLSYCLSVIRYTILKYFLPFHKLPFNLLTVSLMLRVCKLDVFHLSVFASVACVFGKIMGDKGYKIPFL